MAMTITDEMVERTAKVLKPFAAYADPRRKVPRELPIGYGSPLAKPQLTMGDCYDAVDALAALEAAHQSDPGSSSGASCVTEGPPASASGNVPVTAWLSPDDPSPRASE